MNNQLKNLRPVLWTAGGAMGYGAAAKMRREAPHPPSPKTDDRTDKAT